MSDNTLTSIVSILVAVLGVATVAVIVSNSANTSNVITAGGNAFTNILKAAVSPVSGSGLGGVSLPSISPGS